MFDPGLAFATTKASLSINRVSSANMAHVSMPSADLEKEAAEVTELEQSTANGTSWTADEEKKLVRKIDLFLMPTIWIMYLLSYMVSSVSNPVLVWC